MMDINKIADYLNLYEHGFNIVDWCGTPTKPLRWHVHSEGCLILQQNLKTHDDQDNWVNLGGSAIGKDIAQAIVDNHRFRWIKLSEAKTEEMPSNHEEVEILCYPQMRHGQKDSEYYYAKAMYIRDEIGKYSFYPYFTWSVVEEFISDPESAKRVYGDRTYVHIRNVVYFRRINKEDLPAFEPRKKVEF